MTNKIPNTKPGEIIPGGFTYPNNAQINGDFFYIRDLNGIQIPGREIYDGDKITVLDVSYSRQLVLVQYSSGAQVRQGYIKNVPKLIKYFYDNEWHNGSTIENVFDETNKILGSLAPYESATPLYMAEGKIHVVYNTSKGEKTKSRYVSYNGGFTKFQSMKPDVQLTANDTGFVSQKLINFIKSYEGFYPNVYDDGTGIKTIGYGTTNPINVSLGFCTEAQAVKWLSDEVSEKAMIIKNDLNSKNIQLNQNQFDSLCSFAYNCGTTALLQQSNLYQNVCAGVRDERLRENFLAWTHGSGNVMPGLVKRRNAECDMFLYGKYSAN